jgi:hypothetical protein
LLLDVDPPIGEDYTYLVPGDFVVYPLTVMCRFTTSAAIGDRALTVDYLGPDGVRFCVGGAPVTAGPSDVHAFCWQPTAGTPSWVVGDAVVAALAPIFLYPTYTLRVHVTNGDPGDQLDSVRLAAYFYPRDS